MSAASGGNSEPKQGQRSQSARGFCPRSTMRVPQPDIIEHFGNADAVPQLPERCLSRKAGIVRYCLKSAFLFSANETKSPPSTIKNALRAFAISLYTGFYIPDFFLNSTSSQRTPAPGGWWPSGHRTGPGSGSGLHRSWLGRGRCAPRSSSRLHRLPPQLWPGWAP